MRLLSLLLAFCLAAPALAQTPEEHSRLDWALQRGRLLFEIDRAAWVTTDDLRAKLPDPGGAGVRGWTVERDGNGYVVVYYAPEDGGGFLAVYRGRVENNRVVSSTLFAPGARPPLTSVQRRLAQVRSVVTRMNRQPCTNGPFNVTVIPPDRPDGPIDVYALSAQTETEVYPFGGHFRATVSSTGEIIAQRAFTNSCINIPRNEPNGVRSEALVITHLLDKVPTEIHVFLSIWTGLPIYVGTNDPYRLWEVTRDHILLVDPPRSPPAPRT